MPTASAAASPATRRWACRRIWMAARWSAGSTPTTGTSTATCSPATGAPTSRSTARWRTATEEIPSPAVCSVFRTYQGWTALTPQGPGDGTLQLVPIAKGIMYLLLRPLLEDVPEEMLCGAEPGRALSMAAEWHPALAPAVSPIPLVEPGDTVWWHPDIVHAVEDEHRGKGYSNVIYIGAAPHCAKNAEYLARQKAAFLKGESAPDFAPENYEVRFDGRATTDDLTELGKRQMGIERW